MLNITSTDAIGMFIAAAALISAALWAEGFRKKTRDIVGARKAFFTFSIVVSVVCLGAILFKGFNFGMDFKGGTLVEVGFVENQDSLTPEAVRNVIKAYSDENKLAFKDPQVQIEEKALNANQDTYRRVIIRLGRENESALNTQEVEGLALALESKLGRLYRTVKKAEAPVEAPSGAPSASASGAPAASASGAPAASASGAPAASPEAAESSDISLAILSRETISSVVGSELWVNSLLALVVALVLQLIYITIRFGNQVRYGLAADIALVHDVIIMAGLYSLTSRQVDSPFLAALLTVIGFSVMDSIVVFDRIRENVKHTRKGNYTEICNTSLNQTMSRSVNTTLTVLLTLFALYFFGGDTLRNFAFALLVGITAGAYSSIFIATPLVVIFDEMTKKREEERVSERRREREAAGFAKRDDGADDPSAPRRRASDAEGPVDDDGEDDDADAEHRVGATRRRNKARRRR